MKLLELLSGTGSVGTVAKGRGWEVVSLDLNNADINCNILDWDFNTYHVGYFDFIHVSPPYTGYSRAKTVGIRNIEDANKIDKTQLKSLNTSIQGYGLSKNPKVDC